MYFIVAYYMIYECSFLDNEGFMIEDDDPAVSDLILHSEDTNSHQTNYFNEQKQEILSLDHTSVNTWIVAIVEIITNPNTDFKRSHFLLGFSVSSQSLKKHIIENDSTGLKLIAALDLWQVR